MWHLHLSVARVLVTVAGVIFTASSAIAQQVSEACIGKVAVQDPNRPFPPTSIRYTLTNNCGSCVRLGISGLKNGQVLLPGNMISEEIAPGGKFYFTLPIESVGHWTIRINSVTLCPGSSRSSASPPPRQPQRVETGREDGTEVAEEPEAPRGPKILSSYVLCQGQHRANCMPTDLWIKCTQEGGPAAGVFATNYCLPSRATLALTSSRGGNMCGYTKWTLACVEAPQINPGAEGKNSATITPARN